MNWLADELQRRVKPGHATEVSRIVLEEATRGRLPGWTAREWVMENIVGSAYEWESWVRPETGNVIFMRRKEPLTDGRRTYVSPDRRHLCHFDGVFYFPISEYQDTGRAEKQAATGF